MKHTETINSRSWAREARRHCRIRKFSHFESVHAWVHTLTDLGWIRARPCWHYSGVDENNHLARRIELTGGWIVEARPQDAKLLLSLRNRIKRWRIPGPVTLDKLSRYMGTAEKFLRETRILTAARENLYRFVETRDVPATIREQADHLKLPMSYQDMDVEQCAEWHRIAAGWAPKQEAQA